MCKHGCVKIGGKHVDRPILHRKMGTISVANIHRRKLLEAPKGKLAIVKLCDDSLNQNKIVKHVRWATPLERVHTFDVPAGAVSTVDENINKPPKMPTMDVKTALSLMTKAATRSTPYFCFNCEQYYSSQSWLNRHKETKKHQMQVIRQSGGNPLISIKSERVEQKASPSDQAVADVEMDTVEIVTKPMDVPSFYCSDCYQQYSSRKQWNRHQKTNKHQDNVLMKLVRNKVQHQQQAWTKTYKGKFLIFCKGKMFSLILN